MNYRPPAPEVILTTLIIQTTGEFPLLSQ
jgi:hypothetical protein